MVSVSTNVEEWFSSQGQEQVHEIRRDDAGGTNNNPMLTRGAFGEISIAIWKGTDHWRLTAVKTIVQSVTTGASNMSTSSWSPSPSSTKPKLAREVFHEICALRLLHPHPNIVHLLAVFPANGRQSFSGHQSSVSLELNYCPTDLHLTLEYRRQQTSIQLLSLEVIKAIALDMFSAVGHCHSHGVLHRDIKPGNLLVSSSGFIQLCDFGLAKPFQPLQEFSVAEAATQTPMTDTPGDEDRGLCTLYYRPPELLLGGVANDPAVDMYSAGTVLAELLLTGRPLFPGDNVLGQLGLVFDALGTPDSHNWPGVHNLPDYGKLKFAPRTRQPLETLLPRCTESPFFLELLKNLIVLDPVKRLSAREALGHSWLMKHHNSTTTCSLPAPATRAVMQQELIPNALREPILLSTPVASQQALKHAAARRSFLSSLKEWNNSQSDRTSIRDKCQLLSSSLINS